MRKLLLLILAVPMIANAQFQGIESATSVATGFFGWIIPVFLVICVIGAGVAYIVGHERTGGWLAKLIAPLAMFFICIKMFPIFSESFGGNSAMPPLSAPVVIPEKPGVFSIAFDWIGSHLLPLAFGVGLIGATVFLLNRSLSKRAAGLRVKADVSDLLQSIEEVDELMEYWRGVIQATKKATDQASDGISTLGRVRSALRGIVPGGKKEADQALDRISALGGVRSVLMPMLEQAHEGTPLSDIQRAALEKAKADIAKAGHDSAGNSIRNGDEMPSQNQVPSAPSPARSKPRSSRTISPGAQPAAAGGSLTADLLNPLNPLSPISPFSVWGDGRHERIQRPMDDETRRGFDTPTVQDECRYDPPRDAGEGSSGSDSCSSGSSDSGSGSFD